MQKRVVFDRIGLPWLLLAPQLLVTLIFFVWPAVQAVQQAFLVEDAFGLAREFVWFDNFEKVLADDTWLNALGNSVIIGFSVAATSMGVALLLAVMADRVIRGAATYKMLLIWPYAVAPAVAGVLWWFLFNPTIGVLPYVLRGVGYSWNHLRDGHDALILVIVAASWKQISYNFIFFLAGLQAIPRSLIEAAAIDGAGPFKRFWTIVFPLLSPTAFFLLVVDLVYAFIETFGVIHATTGGGPARATETLVYKVFNDGFIGLDFGGSSAQSVMLMLLVGMMTVVQFRWIERRVEY